MTSTTDPAATVDRRAQRKERTHRAIIDAAAALMSQTGGTTFSVEDLADCAGVSRRTVFNHFASMDDVVAAVAADAFGAVHDAVIEIAHAEPDAGPRRWLTGALARADLLEQMAALSAGLGICEGYGAEPAVPAHQAMLLLRAVMEVGDQMTTDLLDAHPHLEPVAVELEVARTMSSLVVLHRHWLGLTGGRADTTSRETWNQLIDHLNEKTEEEGHHG